MICQTPLTLAKVKYILSPINDIHFRIVYNLRPANSIRTDRIALAHSHEQYRSKRGIFKLYQIVCIWTTLAKASPTKTDARL